MKNRFDKVTEILGAHAIKLYEYMYREKIDIENPTMEEAWIICQYKIISLLYNAFKEAQDNDKRRSQKNGK